MFAAAELYHTVQYLVYRVYFVIQDEFINNFEWIIKISLLTN